MGYNNWHIVQYGAKMSTITLIILALLYRGDSILLTPKTIDELIVKNYAVKSQQYSTYISANELYRSFFSLFFVPEISFTKTKIDDNLPTYNENGELRLTLFSPSRVSSFTRNFMAYKKSQVAFKQARMSKYLEIIELIFSYEYLREKLQGDSIMLERAKRIYNMALERLKLGLGDSLELYSAMDNLESVKLAYLEDENSIKQKELEIKLALNFVGPFAVDIDSFYSDKIDAVDYRNAYSIKLAKKEEKSACLDEVLVWLSLLPEVGITYKKDYVGSVFESSIDNFTYSKTFGVYLTFYPLDFVFNIKRSKLERKKALMSLKDIEFKEKENFTGIKYRLRFLRKKLEMLYTRLKLKEKSFNLSLEKYSLGEFSMQDILKEQVDYMSVMSEYFKTRLDIMKLMLKIRLNYGGNL